MARRPALTGRQLINLFLMDGWVIRGRTNHGISLSKADDTGQKRAVIIPSKPGALPQTMLSRILAVKQSGVGSAGLRRMIDKHGIPAPWTG